MPSRIFAARRAALLGLAAVTAVGSAVVLVAGPAGAAPRRAECARSVRHTSVRALPHGFVVRATAPHSCGGRLTRIAVKVTDAHGHSRYFSAPARARRVVTHGQLAEYRYRLAVTATSARHRTRPVVRHRTTALALVNGRSPAPATPSRYLRALTGNVSRDAAALRRMGAADAAVNGRQHRHLQLLDIGAQFRGGVVLSATTRYITYPQLVGALEGYLSGYVAAQRRNAPAVIALGTNNDGSVSGTQGGIWANDVVDPLAGWLGRHAHRHLQVAGANDIEPGFSAGPRATGAWLSGFLRSTRQPFFFNGSADGCPESSWTTRCNNGWTTDELHWLAGGAAPTRIYSLPQIYYTAMPWQWQVISSRGARRLSFAGPLTEVRACAQARSCYSMGSARAWDLLWKALRSNRRTSVNSMPYATDLRIS